MLFALALATGLAPGCGPGPALGPALGLGREPVTALAEDALFGTWERTFDDLPSPTAVYLEDDGRLWVVTAGDHRVRAFDLDDRDEGRASVELGGFGTQGDRLRDPGGIVVAPDRVFVADTGNDRIQVFERSGLWRGEFGRRGTQPGRFRAPRGLDFRKSLLAVADTENHRVQVLDSAGAPRLTFGERGRGPGQFEFPHDVAWLEDGRLVVADTGNQRIQVFDRRGRFEREFGTWGWRPGTFGAPVGVAVSDGRLYVVERDNNRVQVFAFDGRRLGGWGLHALLPREGEGKLHYPCALDVRAGHAVLAEESVERVQVFGPGVDEDYERARASESGSTTTPHFGGGIGADGDLVAVVRPENADVAVYDMRLGEPVEITRFGDHGTGPGRFRAPVDALVDAARDRVWVSDRSNRTLQAFELGRAAEGPMGQLARAPRFVKALDFAALPVERGGLGATPGRLAAAPDGGLFVIDETHARVFELGADLRVRAVYGSGELERPVDLAWQPRTSELFVLDAARRSVAVFALAGSDALNGRIPRAFEFGGEGSGPGRFLEPAGLAIDRAGWVWVLDRRAAALQKLSSGGAYEQSVGRLGLEALEFYKPAGLAARSDGGLVIADEGNHRLQFLDAQGRFEQTFGARLFTRLAPRRR